MDLLLRGGFASRWGNNFAQELRVGFESSRRDYTTFQGPIETVIATGLQPFGTNANLPGEFSRNTLRMTETLHYITGSHSLKFGGGLTAASVEQSFVHGRRGEFFFSGVDDFTNLQGVFVSAGAGTTPVASYSSLQFAGFLQDTWTAAPGLEVVLGLRYENEGVPSDKVTPNQEWLTLTGLDNSALETVNHKLSPRFAFSFFPGEASQWVVRGEAGVYYGLIESAVLGEVMTHDGAVLVRRGAGNLGEWPAAPNAAAAPVTGSRLSLLGPRFEAPRTSRLGLGVSRALGPQAAIHLAGSYRHTDFLVRRADLNRNSAVATDQHGRPIYGTLVKTGQLLSAVQGTNRRFPGFDLVSALNPDGYSDYTDFTVTLERTLAESARMFVAYTFSRTEDNWLGGWGGGPDDQLNPFPDSLNGVDWAEGTSDFDIPHRFVVGAEVGLPVGENSRIAGFLRRESGRPFTPGYRDGVDANGDGSARNDVAFVDETVAGVSDLLAEWVCLRDAAGGFAARNACRGPARTRLDITASLGLISISGYPLTVFVDALNLLDSEDGVPDGAVYVIDAGSTIQTDPVGGTITVPLIANPNFGAPLVKRGFGRLIRVGARVNY
jgi:hypothetical protein